jgi:hypothetical protein
MTYQAPVFPDAFNMADYFVFSNIEAGRGSKVAIHFEGRAITYAELADNVTGVRLCLVWRDQSGRGCHADQPAAADNGLFLLPRLREAAIRVCG